MKLVRESESLPGLIASLAKRHGDKDDESDRFHKRKIPQEW